MNKSEEKYKYVKTENYKNNEKNLDKNIFIKNNQVIDTTQRNNDKNKQKMKKKNSQK